MTIPYPTIDFSNCEKFQKGAWYVEFFYPSGAHWGYIGNRYFLARGGAITSDRGFSTLSDAYDKAMEFRKTSPSIANNADGVRVTFIEDGRDYPLSPMKSMAEVFAEHFAGRC